MSQTAKYKNVYFLLYEGVQLLDVAGPAEVLAQANKYCARTAYKIKYVGVTKTGSITTSAGLRLAAEALPTVTDSADIVILPGADEQPLRAVLNNQQLMSWLSKVVSSVEFKVSVCSGAFILGKLGQLDGIQSTTHWRAAEQLQSMYPKSRVEQDALFSNEKGVWTSAGVTSGIDMMLAFVKQDLGAKIALAIARELVVFLIRDGGQSQFSGAINFQSKACSTSLVDLVSWLESNVREVVTVDRMAEYLNVSVRTLHRQCLKSFGLTPANLFSALRLEHSRDLLHQHEMAIKTIAFSCGYSTQESFSSAFKQRYGIAPSVYRERFKS